MFLSFSDSSDKWRTKNSDFVQDKEGFECSSERMRHITRNLKDWQLLIEKVDSCSSSVTVLSPVSHAKSFLGVLLPWNIVGEFFLLLRHDFEKFKTKFCKEKDIESNKKIILTRGLRHTLQQIKISERWAPPPSCAENILRQLVFRNRRASNYVYLFIRWNSSGYDMQSFVIVACFINNSSLVYLYWTSSLMLSARLVPIPTGCLVLPRLVSWFSYSLGVLTLCVLSVSVNCISLGTRSLSSVVVLSATLEVLTAQAGDETAQYSDDEFCKFCCEYVPDGASTEGGKCKKNVDYWDCKFE